MQAAGVSAVFDEQEAVVLRSRVCVCAELSLDEAWACERFESTPYLFHLMEAMAIRLSDRDSQLPSMFARLLQQR